MSSDEPSYVLGHSDRELARLERQAAFFAEMTRDILLRAGLRPGMRVLDVGCGVGDVTAIAADIVGHDGEVVGIDISREALGVAEARMRASGRRQAQFRETPLEAFDGIDGFDAVIGRFILLHMADPAAVLVRLAQEARAGARIAFIEMDMSTAAAIPPLPLLATQIGHIIELYRRAGRQADMGSQLFASYRAAGLSPDLVALTRVASGHELAGFEFVTESIRSLLPFITRLGVATAEEIGIDTLYDRLVAEAGAHEHCIFYPRLVGAWAATGTVVA
ncbi:class I SAM-dependent methyltransferase [Ancylobacter terrae]|uniref:class I SAM-dependent methyltransferase n=1 Tax=Ancylobacter sp. sgz301288 TaxID=3342077 RepID=UPI003859AD5E